MLVIPDGVHQRIASLLDFRLLHASKKNLLYRWAINHREKALGWSADTLSSRLQFVTIDIKIKSLTASHGPRTHVERVRPWPRTQCRNRGYHVESKFFGDRATESSVVLDYIDPTVVPTTSDWYFFGWLTPWGGQPHNYPPDGDMMAYRSPHSFVNDHIVKL
jgi:hypothetical protein